jgi:hypothetical protein
LLIDKICFSDLQVSLLEESITPRHNLPPLLHKLSERKPERLDWIGKKKFRFILHSSS